jgi:hypothetical protein
MFSFVISRAALQRCIGMADGMGTLDIVGSLNNCSKCADVVASFQQTCNRAYSNINLAKWMYRQPY